MRPLFLTLALTVLPLALPATAAGVPDLEGLGQALFVDPSLSVTGTQSCASCHDPTAGFAASDVKANAGGGVVEGAVPGRFGNRKPPSLAYAGLAPVLHHAMTSEGLTFIGGDFADGRARGDVTGTPLGDQAEGPFLNPQEMAMPDAACVVLRACQAGADGLISRASAACAAVTKADIASACTDPAAKITLDDATRASADDAFALIAKALAAYERSPAVERFSSRFDAWTAGTGTLTPDEVAGFDIFTGKGKCAQCHVVTRGAEGEPPLFTDFTFDNIGVPKNPENPWYGQVANPVGKAWLDKGLSVTLRQDPVYASYADDVVGAIKVPTLRNLDARLGPDGTRSYGHNGYFKSIEGIVHFYNTRDVLPRCAAAMVTEAEALAQNCWPAPEMPATMNRDELGNLKLSATEEAELVAFLKTLTDE
jgi:cytochrome c peroxidase